MYLNTYLSSYFDQCLPCTAVSPRFWHSHTHCECKLSFSLIAMVCQYLLSFLHGANVDQNMFQERQSPDCSLMLGEWSSFASGLYTMAAAYLMGQLYVQSSGTVWLLCCLPPCCVCLPRGWIRGPSCSWGHSSWVGVGGWVRVLLNQGAGYQDVWFQKVIHQMGQSQSALPFFMGSMHQFGRRPFQTLRGGVP